MLVSFGANVTGDCRTCSATLEAVASEMSSSASQMVEAVCEPMNPCPPAPVSSVPPISSPYFANLGTWSAATVPVGVCHVSVTMTKEVGACFHQYPDLTISLKTGVAAVVQIIGPT